MFFDLFRACFVYLCLAFVFLGCRDTERHRCVDGLIVCHHSTSIGAGVISLSVWPFVFFVPFKPFFMVRFGLVLWAFAIFPRAFTNFQKINFSAGLLATPAWPLSFSTLLGSTSVSGWVCEYKRIQVKLDEPPRIVQESFLFKEVLFAHFYIKIYFPSKSDAVGAFFRIQTAVWIFIVVFLCRP